MTTTLSPEFIKAREDFAAWYDSKSEDEQQLIDEISDRTYYIIDEDEYETFIEELNAYGITTAGEFEDAFEAELEGHSEKIYAEFSENLCDGLWDIKPEFIANCVDWELVWYSTLRYDYNAIESNGNTYFFRNI